MTTTQKAHLLNHALACLARSIAQDDQDALGVFDPSLASVSQHEASEWLLNWSQDVNHVIANGASNIYGVEGIFLTLSDSELQRMAAPEPGA